MVFQVEKFDQDLISIHCKVFQTYPMIDEYQKAAIRYRPDRIRVLFLAESPPAPRPCRPPSYFFFPNSFSDLLFATVIFALYGIRYKKDPVLKESLLQKFRADGFWLMDAVEYPINNIPKPHRPEKVRADLPNLLGRLNSLRQEGVLDETSGIAIIMEDVWKLLAPVLAEQGYYILNRNRYIGFPGYYYDQRTVDEIRKILPSFLGSMHAHGGPKKTPPSLNS